MSKAEVLWQVVGGAASGGIVVRSGASLTTQQADLRLANGAIVQQLEAKSVRGSGRLRYELVRGTGPSTGWVSLCLHGKDLLKRCSAVPESSKDAGTEQVLAKLQKDIVASAPAYSMSPTPMPWVPQGSSGCTSYKGQCPTAQDIAKG
ncbi:unnamed protein product [Symbiodinium sp. CCMP2456]|nr:unnamed protein product [Symbiodinium sp. CCMP2456]